MIQSRKMLKQQFVIILAFLVLVSCSTESTQSTEKNAEIEEVTYPSDVYPLNDWRLMLGNGKYPDSLTDFQHPDYFYSENDGENWVVFKTPNGGVTSPNSHNTRTEFGQIKRWTPEEGGRLTGTLKVQHVSRSGDATIAASFSVVVGQIHSDEGHKNEPLKIFYKKFPEHGKGSVFWNYEINTEGDNKGRWDYSTPVWGYDMSVVGKDAETAPEEPAEGIKLGEEFSYEVNVFEGVMYLTFTSPGHPTRTFTKNLLESDYQTMEEIPQQTKDLFFPIGQDGTEQAEAYAGELQFFKQGAYNQTNGRDPVTNRVWSTGSNTYEGDVASQYENGSYAEVWFKSSTISAGVPPANPTE
jgi:hypothetical protein